MPRNRVLAAIVVAVVVVSATTTAMTHAAVTEASFRLVVSERADGLAAVRLNDAQISGDVAIFVTRSTQGRSVAFRLDGKRHSVDASAPFDFEGTAADGSANMFDASSLSVGRHRIVAVLTSATGLKTTATASFEVVADDSTGTTTTTAAPATTTTTKAPATTVAPTPAPSTTTTKAPTTTTVAPAPPTTCAPSPSPQRLSALAREEASRSLQALISPEPTLW